MSLYTNNIPVPGGRRVASSEPMDDRIYYSSESDVQTDIANMSPDRWYEGMRIVTLDTLIEYSWISEDLVIPDLEEMGNTSYTYGAGHIYEGKTFKVYKLKDVDIHKPISQPQQQALDQKMDLSVYDPDENGVVEYSAQSATNGKNLTANTIPALSLITIFGAVPGEDSLSIGLADATSSLPCFGITLSEIPVGGKGLIVTRGYVGPIELVGGAVGNLVYLNGLGVPQLTAPESGLVQSVGIIISMSGDFAFLGINPQTTDDRNTFVRTWKANTPYEKSHTFSTSSDVIPGVTPGFIILLRVKIEDYVSSNNIVTDYDDGKIEIIGGDMHSNIYDPTEKSVDAFNAENFDDGITKVIMTVSERNKLAGLEDPNYKGTYTNPEALRAAHPSANQGNEASILSTSTRWIWNSAGTPTPPEVGGAWEDSLIAFGGDMQKSEYDPTNVAGDAFSMGNMAETTNEKIFTNTERLKLSGIQENAQVNRNAAATKIDYESNSNTNAFTDNEKLKLAKEDIFGGIEMPVGIVPLAADSGEITTASVLIPNGVNITQPANGRIEFTKASRVMVTVSTSVTILGTSDIAEFTLALNGTPIANAQSNIVAPSGNSGTPESNSPNISYPINVVATDYISVFHSGDPVTIYNMQITVIGHEL